MLFSIITVTFRAEATLPRTLRSVSQQTWRDYEHIIVDGGSTDGTLALIKEAGLPYVSEPDRGIYDAMNKGLKLAGGQYVVFLNAGDTFHAPDTLARLASLVQGATTLPAVLYGQTSIVDDEGRFLRPRHLSAPQRLTSRSFLGGMLVCHQSFYARADLAKATPFDLRLRFSADYDWCIRIMKLAEAQGLPMVNANATLTDYLAEGTTTRNHRRSLAERFRAMAGHYGFVRASLAHLWFALGRPLSHGTRSK